MGWWFFWGIVLFLIALIVVPLSLRLRIRLSWRSDGDLDYTIVYGPIPLMPGFPEVTKEWFESKKSTILKILNPLIFIVSIIFKMIKALVKFIAFIINGIKRLFKKKDEPFSVSDDKEVEEEDFEYQERDDFAPFSDSKEAEKEEISEDAHLDEIKIEAAEEKIEPSSESHLDIKEQTEEEYTEDRDIDFDDDDESEEEEISSEKSDENIIEEKDEVDEDKSGLNKNILKIFSLLDSLVGYLSSIGDRADETWQQYESFIKKANYYLSLWRQHKPVVLKTFRRLITMLNGLRKKIRFREFEIRLMTGGDPASLGSAMGYSKALAGSIHPALVNHIYFDPDFEDYTFNPKLSVNLDVSLRPILLFGPFLRLLVTLPYIGLWRVYKSLSKELKDE